MLNNIKGDAIPKEIDNNMSRKKRTALSSYVSGIRHNHVSHIHVNKTIYELIYELYIVKGGKFISHLNSVSPNTKMTNNFLGN